MSAGRCPLSKPPGKPVEMIMNYNIVCLILWGAF